MDVVVRAPLFYAMDVWFNKMTAAVHQQNENPTFSTEQNLTTFSSLQNSTYKIETEFFNFDWLLNWPINLFFNISIITMVMFALASHLKNLVLVLLCTLPVIVCTWIATYYYQNSPIIINLNVVYVLLVRSVVFSSLCGFILYQMIVERGRRKWHALIEVLLFFLLSTLNPPDVQFQLAKYLLCAYLLTFSDAQSRFKLVVRVVSLFALFIVFHLAPLHLKTEEEDVTAWKTTFYEQGMSVARVTLGVSALGMFTLCVEKIASYFLFRETNRGKFTWISPVYFYAFILEKQLRGMSPNELWAFVQIHLATHFMATLINVCEVAASSVMVMAEADREPAEANRMKNRARILYFLTIFGAVCGMVYAGLMLTPGPEMIIITVYVVFTSVVNAFSIAPINDDPDQQIENAFRFPLLIFISVYMLVQVFMDFDLSLLVGALCYANLIVVHFTNAAPYFGRFRRVKGYVDSIPKISSEKLSAMDDEDDKCCICLEKMSSGCETECEHCYHENCLARWLNVNDKCPICLRVLYREPRIDEELQEVALA